VTSRRRKQRPNSIAGQFAAHPIDMMESPAWRALSLSARKCLSRIEIELADHGGRDNGQLPVPYRDFCAYGVWRGAIKPALAELVALGFIEMTPGYACQNPSYGRPAKFRILFRTYRDGPQEEHRWRRFKTDGEAKAAATAARAAAMRRRRTKASSHGSPDGTRSEPLSSSSSTEPLWPVRKPNHCPLLQTERLSTVSVGGPPEALPSTTRLGPPPQWPATDGPLPNGGSTTSGSVLNDANAFAQPNPNTKH
jgi:hypothetical protein